MIDEQTIAKICAAAEQSAIAKSKWKDRGRAPLGYINGMAATYALCLNKLAAGDSAANAMVRVVENGKDVFDHLAGKLADAKLTTDGASDTQRLRALFVILLGLGMRESSGRYCEGRDRSASNTTAETAEAGLFQQSWDSRRASPEIEKLFRERAQIVGRDKTDDIDALFKVGVVAKEDELQNYGSGDGSLFQFICKNRPSYAVQFAAIGLRTLYTHWGPIIRREVEVLPAAADLFREVERIVGATTPVVTAQKPAAGWVSLAIGALLALFRKAPSVSPPVATGTPGPAKPPDDLSWMRWSRKEIGFHEIGVNQGTEKYIDLAKCGSRAELLGQPYCAVFCNAAFEANGIPGTRSAMARSFEDSSNFTELRGPAYGAVVTMWRGSPSAGTGHVGFYVGENEHGVILLNANDGDAVRISAPKPRNRITGYWWPKSQPLPAAKPIIISSGDGDQDGRET